MAQKQEYDSDLKKMQHAAHFVVVMSKMQELEKLYSLFLAIYLLNLHDIIFLFGTLHFCTFCTNISLRYFSGYTLHYPF